jgi:hypothetical protein
MGSARAGPGADVLPVRGDVGTTAWISCAGNLPWGQSTDQRPDETLSLTYTWEQLEDELEIWGHPRLRVRVMSSEPVAYLSAKVCDVFPDGTSSLVVRGVLNLAHRKSREAPTPLVPGHPYDIDFELEACSWTFERGHRIRLDLAGADWPNAWAPPAAGELSVDRDASSLVLPALDGPSPVVGAPSLQAVAGTRTAKPTPRTADGPTREGVLWSVEEDLLAHERRADTGATTRLRAPSRPCSTAIKGSSASPRPTRAGPTPTARASSSCGTRRERAARWQGCPSRATAPATT